MSDAPRQIEVLAPATVANLTVGFDCLGGALDGPLERLILKRCKVPGVKIVAIHGAELPFEVEQNVSGRAALSVLEKLGIAGTEGVELEIFKTVLPGSGIGSSAASAASAAFGVNALFEGQLSPADLLECALDGECVASGARHADNVAPALFGGLCLVGGAGCEIEHLPMPDWHLAVVHPHIPILTEAARAVLPANVPLQDALGQMAQLGRFISALHCGDDSKAARLLSDRLVEPCRIPLQPEYYAVRSAAISAGALGGGISGSGPSTFWVAPDQETAQSIGAAIAAVFEAADTANQVHITKLSARGAHIAT